MTPEVVQGVQAKKTKMKEQILDIKKTLFTFKKIKDQERGVMEDLAKKLDQANKAKDMVLTEKKSKSLLFLSCRVQCIEPLSCFMEYQEVLTTHKA